jgi:apolipoprotein N-acyltransferase
VLGNGFAQNIKIIQWYEYTGALGGSFWVLIVNIILYSIIKHIKIYKTLYGQIFNSIILLLILIMPIAYSLHKYSTYIENENPINVVILQPNIDPYGEKFGGMSNYQQLSLMLSLADSLVDENTDYIVGPETSVNDNIWENNIYNSRSVARIDSFVKAHPKTQFVIGATTRHMYENTEPSVTSRPYADGLRYDLYNSALQVSSDKIDIYHKSMLVIGVEMFPYPEYLGFLTEMAIELGGTSGSYGTQAERVAFSNKINKAKVAPVICYESIYGEFVTGYIKKGANVIFVITNDGWWGDTPGYRQHLSFSKLRAIETRRSIARSANTGVSCFINQRGDIISPTKYWVKDALKGTINLNDKKTFYVENGDFIGRISSFVALLLFLMFLVKSVKPEVYTKK